MQAAEIATAETLLPSLDRDAKVELLGLLAREEAAYLENDLREFVTHAWPILEPTTPLIPGWHIDAICEHLEAVTRGDIKRLIINVPPRMTKSLLVSVFWPAWEWVLTPGSRWIFASYSADAATPLSMKRRYVIQSQWYQERWGRRVKLSSDQNLKTEFENTARGAMFSSSVGGTVTSRGGTRIVIDDPHNPQEALSDTQRQAAIEFYQHTLSTRLDDPKTGAMVLIQQRLHEEDLSGWLEKNEPGRWTILRLPMEAEAREVVALPSGKQHVRSAGDLLCTERFGPAEVATLKIALGSYQAAGQLQQRPSPAEGGSIKRWWWKFYDVLPGEFDEQLQSWDLAFKDATTSDYVVGQVWGKRGGNFYLLDEVRDRMDFPATCAAIQMLSLQWPKATTKLVEDKANGPAVISSLRNSISGLIPVKPRGSKQARASAVSPLIEAGNVFLPLPSKAPWVSDFIEELAIFPNGAHDDRVDACSQALDRWIARGATKPTPPMDLKPLRMKHLLGQLR